MANTACTDPRALDPAERGPMATCWILTAGIGAIDIAWMARDGWSLPWRTLAQVVAVDLLLCAPLLSRRYREAREIAAMLQAAAFLVSFTAVAAMLSYLAVALGAPLVDAPLAAADRALGFDFVSMQASVRQHPGLAWLMDLAYASGLAQLALVVIALGAWERTAQLRQFLRTFAAATMIAIAVSAWFSAAGPWTFLGAGNAGERAALSHFDALRDGLMRAFPGAGAQGLISMPSLHAATAVLFMHALRGTPMAPAAIAWNALMLAATPMFGGHYLVDVIAGIALAATVIAADRPAFAARSAPRAAAPRDLALTREQTT